MIAGADSLKLMLETVLLYALGILVVLVGLALSIGLHELGHLLPAKRFGVKVTKYMIGFGPTLWSRRKGETEYGFKLLPLGGYISMAGMYPPSRDGDAPRDSSTSFFDAAVQEGGADEDDERGFYRLPVWKRIVVMLGGPFANLVLAVVCATIVLCGFGLPQPSTTIASVSECVLPVTSDREECAPGDPAAPAAAAGIRPGDRIVSVDGVAISSWDESSDVIRAHPEEPIPFVVERDGEQLELTVTPLLLERYEFDEDGAPVLGPDGEPVVAEVGVVGIGPGYENVRQSILAVPVSMGERIAAAAGVIASFPQRIYDIGHAWITGEERDPNGPLSVVGVGRLAGEITSFEEVPVEYRIASLVDVLGALNLALFLFNLIPLLPLDGGHIAGALWEALRRGVARLARRPDPGPVDISRWAPVTMVVAVLLGAVGVFLIAADIFKPITLL